jgi:hypothetical protein
MMEPNGARLEHDADEPPRQREGLVTLPLLTLCSTIRLTKLRRTSPFAPAPS